jgi:hypothetical protein
MATPHLAGSAAVVINQHPDWAAADVRSAIVNTAVRGALLDFETGEKICSMQCRRAYRLTPSASPLEGSRPVPVRAAEVKSS